MQASIPGTSLIGGFQAVTNWHLHSPPHHHTTTPPHHYTASAAVVDENWWWTVITSSKIPVFHGGMHTHFLFCCVCAAQCSSQVAQRSLEWIKAQLIVLQMLFELFHLKCLNHFILFLLFRNKRIKQWFFTIENFQFVPGIWNMKFVVSANTPVCNIGQYYECILKAKGKNLSYLTASVTIIGICSFRFLRNNSTNY